MFKHTHPRRTLKLESLEARQCMAGNVLASLNAANDLVIQGDDAHNYFTVQPGETPSEFLLVGELDAAGARTTINGLSRVAISGVTGEIRVSTGAGNDAVWFDQVTSPGRLQVATGSGPDQVYVVNSEIKGKLTVDSGDQGDFIEILDSIVHKSTSLISGSGVDEVVMSGSTFMSELVADTGSGDDKLRTRDNLFDELVLRTGFGDDRIELNHDTIDTLTTRTREGNDDIIFSNMDVLGDTILDTGDGDDMIYMESSTFNGRFAADGGAGANDEFYGLDAVYFNTYASTPVVRGFRRVD